MKSSVRVLAAVALVGVLGVERVREKEARPGARASSAAARTGGQTPGTAATAASGARASTRPRADRGRDLREEDPR